MMCELCATVKDEVTNYLAVKLVSRFPVGPTEYAYYEGQIPEDNTLGFTCSDRASIVVDASLPAAKKRAVLVHELCHAALAESPFFSIMEKMLGREISQNEEESIVMCLECGLTPALTKLGFKVPKAGGR